MSSLAPKIPLSDGLDVPLVLVLSGRCEQPNFTKIFLQRDRVWYMSTHTSQDIWIVTKYCGLLCIPEKGCG